ncbi:glycosyltransferase [Rhizosphaericola mali]|uniref:Glycosyltransferase n=1 Tax=Rhizosphaericola mali TaxID=2545455 RepID=A0A5P2GFY7_9BACT|nr:glycosyltransferase [Rhizosphaericola mali]QES90571.1 glycosyltransferase [Rhizosphaericola mali]
MNIIIIGPAHPLRGGLASFDERLARAFKEAGHNASIYTFSLQYPGFLFPGTTQFSDEPAPTDIDIKVCINSVNPLNWRKVGKELKNLRPDIILIRYWLPFMAPCLGTILRFVKKNKHTRTVCLADNIIPHEHFPMQTQLTNYLVKTVDGFVTMSGAVLQDLKKFTQKPAVQIVHPLYDNFGVQISKLEARKHLQIAENQPWILFFGFIRKYKGLDILLESMHLLQEKGSDIQLIVAGEFYGDRKPYDDTIEKYQLKNVHLHTNFITDSEVKYYLSAADFVIQPYRDATQSGVTPLAYHFEKPMLVTNVGGLPDMVPDGKVGVVTEPTSEAVAIGIEKLYAQGESHYLPYLQIEKQKYSWAKAVESMIVISGISQTN